jgi:serine protease
MRISLLIASLLAAASFNALADRASPRQRPALEATQVHGLVVQLREAPTHGAMARERGQAASGSTAPLADRERLRWQRVLSTLPPLQLAERRAVGESAQALRFQRPLSREQALALADTLSRDGDVAWAMPSTRERRLAVTVNDPDDREYGGQWWLQPNAVRNEAAPGYRQAWQSWTTGAAGAVVAVLDNGIVDHPDLAGKVINGHDMVSDTAFSNDRDGRDTVPSDPGDWVDAADLQLQDYKDFNCQPEPSSWHGTVIAGMLAANSNNSVGGASMNWFAPVLVVRVAAKCGADANDIIDGIRWVAGLPNVCLRSDGQGVCQEVAPALPQPRARIINISFGGDGECNSGNAPYQPAIDAARARGVVIVAAAGNENAAPTRPAKCAGVIGVAALNRNGLKATYSNFGSMLAVATVGGDNHLPGDDRWAQVADSGLRTVSNDGSTTPGPSSYANYFGTSFSTPVVAGAISLMLSQNPLLTADQIELGLRASARPHVTSSVPGVGVCSNANPGRCLCTADTCGAGILDVDEAVRYAEALRQGNTYTPLNRSAVSIDTPELRAAAATGPDRPANPTTMTPPPSNGGSSGGGGGGAMSAWWLLALAAAVLALQRRPRAR